MGKEQDANNSAAYEEEVKETLTSFSGWGDLKWTPPKKEDIQKLYDNFSTTLSFSKFENYSTFLNLGYVSDGTTQHSRIQLPELYLKKNNTNLVLELIGDCPINREDKVLDVGCGRGGAVSLFRQFFQVAHITGLDLSTEAISFCKQKYKNLNISFEEGDAECLPFANQSFNIITNIESSHNYPDVYAFFQEVSRILKSGGYFLYGDLIPTERIIEYKYFFKKNGFLIDSERDISNNVLLSCDEMAETHAKSLTKNEVDKEVLGEFLLAAGSQSYERLKAGESRYMLFRFHKI